MSTTTHNTSVGGGLAPAIAVFCYGKKGYYAAAQNLALTIRENSPGVQVVLFAGDPSQVDHTLFAAVHHLDPKYYAIGPGTLKASIYDILPEGEWLVMDADMLVTKDLSQYIAALGPHDFAMEYMGKGAADADLSYSPWATTVTMRRVANLPADAIFHGVQSSWMWIRKPAQLAADIFAKAKGYRYTFMDLKEPWGHDIPDELRFATAIAELKVDLPDVKLSFYGGRTPYGFSGIQEPVLCLYGDGRKHRLITPSWLATYDKYLRDLYRKVGRVYTYSLHRIMQDKYVNR